MFIFKDMPYKRKIIKGDKFFCLPPDSTSYLHTTRYAEGGAESSEYGDEKLDDVLPNVFVDCHSELI